MSDDFDVIATDPGGIFQTKIVRLTQIADGKGGLTIVRAADAAAVAKLAAAAPKGLEAWVAHDDGRTAPAALVAEKADVDQALAQAATDQAAAVAAAEAAKEGPAEVKVETIQDVADKAAAAEAQKAAQKP